MHGQTENAKLKRLDGRQQRGDRRRLVLLAAARELFMRDGYRSTTLEAIIRQAGGSREMIYSYFGSKAGLFGAIIAEEGSKLLKAFDDKEFAALAPRQAFTQLGLRLLEIWFSPEGSAINHTVISEGRESPELLEVWYRSGSEPFLRALSNYVQAQIRLGHLNADDPMRVARQYHFLLIGEAAFPIMSGQPELWDAVNAVARSVELLMRAYMPISA
jgi:AcrR family transcriptional regulator